MRKVEVTARVQTTPDRVIQAFIDPQMLSTWWGVERSLIDPQVGGTYTLVWGISEAGFKYISSGFIQQYKPEGLLQITNMVYMNPERPILGPMQLTVRASQQDDHSEMHILQEGYQSGPDWDWYYEAVKDAWPNVARQLGDFLEKS